MREEITCLAPRPAFSNAAARDMVQSGVPPREDCVTLQLSVLTRDPAHSKGSQLWAEHWPGRHRTCPRSECLGSTWAGCRALWLITSDNNLNSLGQAPPTNFPPNLHPKKIMPTHENTSRCIKNSAGQYVSSSFSIFLNLPL